MRNPDQESSRQPNEASQEQSKKRLKLGDFLDARDDFEILGLPRNATQAEIKSVYRKLSRQYHPDGNPGDTEAEDIFKIVTAAYERIYGKSEEQSKTHLRKDAQHQSTDHKTPNKSSTEGTKDSRGAQQELREGVSEALTRLYQAWQRFGRFRPSQIYFQKFEREYSTYIDAQTEAVDLLSQLDQAWNTLIKAANLNMRLPEEYDYYLRMQSKWIVKLDIEKLTYWWSSMTCWIEK